MPQSDTESWAATYAAMFGKPLVEEDLLAWENLLNRDFGPDCNDAVVEAIRGMDGARRFPPTYPELSAHVKNVVARRNPKRDDFPTGCNRCKGGWLYFRMMDQDGRRVWRIDPDPSLNMIGIECICDAGERIFNRRTERGDWRAENRAGIERVRRAIYDAAGQAKEAGR